MVERFLYRGWNNTYKLSNGTIDLILTADVGPRILFYGFCNGENLLHEVHADAGKTGGPNSAFMAATGCGSHRK